jgi:hypothetical protein
MQSRRRRSTGEERKRVQAAPADVDLQRRDEQTGSRWQMSLTNEAVSARALAAQMEAGHPKVRELR